MALIASLALLRPHVLVLELPGSPMLRLRAEAAVRARGWALARGPADADLLLVCGAAAGDLRDAVDAIWAEVPAPRARRTVRSAGALQEALDSAARVLADRELQRSALPGAPRTPPDPGHLGPVGVDWPPGLVVDRAAGPDGRIAAVGLRRLIAEAEEGPDPIAAPVLAVAAAARLLRLAGWAVPAARLDRVVDLAVGGDAFDTLLPRIRRAAAQVRRSATFRWSAARDLPDGDLRGRVLALLDAALRGEPAPAPEARPLIGTRPETLPLLLAVTEPVRG